MSDDTPINDRAETAAGASFSLGSINALESIANRLEAMTTDPKKRLAGYERAAADLERIASAIRQNDSMADALSVHISEARQRREADLETKQTAATAQLWARQETESKAAGTEKWTAAKRDEIKARHGHEMDALKTRQRAAALSLSRQNVEESKAQTDLNDRAAMTRWLAILDAILMNVPAGVRAKVGGFVKLAGLQTDKEREELIRDRVGRMEKALAELLTAKTGRVTALKIESGKSTTAAEKAPLKQSNDPPERQETAPAEILLPPDPSEPRPNQQYGLPAKEGRLALAMAGVCLVLALVKFHALWPYQLSRWALCAGSAWLAWQCLGWRRSLCAALAVIYNPFQPIAFEALWPWVNGVSAMALLTLSPVTAHLVKWGNWRWRAKLRLGKILLIVTAAAGVLWGLVFYITREVGLQRDREAKEAALIAAPVDWWNWTHGALRERTFEAALNGPGPAIAEINAMEKAGLLTDRAAAEWRETWQWDDGPGSYRSVHETKEQREQRNWTKTMAWAYVWQVVRSKLDLDSFSIVEALRQVTTAGKDWRVAANWPAMKEFKEQYPETTEREQWEDVWYPKLCAEYCARLRAQKSAREDLLQKVSEKWKTLSREQKLSAKATPWTMARALAFVEPTRRNEPRIRPSASDIEAVEKTDHEGERSDAK